MIKKTTSMILQGQVFFVFNPWASMNSFLIYGIDFTLSDNPVERYFSASILFAFTLL